MLRGNKKHMAKKEKSKLVAHITPEISIYADHLCYTVIIKEASGNAFGRRTYFITIKECFEEILEHLIRSRLADGKDKTIKEMLDIVNSATKEIRKLWESASLPERP